MTTPTTTERDFDNEDGASERPQVDYDLFGYIALSQYQMMYISKGEPKVPWVSGKHDPQKAYAEYTMKLSIYKKDGSMYENTIKDIEFGSKWKITYRSLKALGVSKRGEIKNLERAYFRAKQVDTGRTYPKELEDGSIEQRKERTVSFVAFYDDEETCLMAQKLYRDAMNGDTNNDTGEASYVPLAPDFDNEPAGEGEDPQITVPDTLRVLWDAAKHNEKTFKSILKANPQLGHIKYDDALAIAQSKPGDDASADGLL